MPICRQLKVCPALSRDLSGFGRMQNLLRKILTQKKNNRGPKTTMKKTMKSIERDREKWKKKRSDPCLSRYTRLPGRNILSWPVVCLSFRCAHFHMMLSPRWMADLAHIWAESMHIIYRRLCTRCAYVIRSTNCTVFCIYYIQQPRAFIAATQKQATARTTHTHTISIHTINVCSLSVGCPLKSTSTTVPLVCTDFVSIWLNACLCLAIF